MVEHQPQHSRTTQVGAVDTRSDQEVLAAVVAGERDALAVLVVRYQRLLLAIVREYSGDEQEPEVVVQEVWIDVMRAAGTFKGRSSVPTWLSRIAVNRARDAVRRRAARPVQVATLEDFDAMDEHDAVDALAGDAVVADLMAALPAAMREAVALVYIDGVPIAEAAQHLGVAVGTVKSRCSRARVLMLARLERRGR